MSQPDTPTTPILRDPDPSLDVEALPSQLSPSRAGEFHKCPRAFFFGTILKQPSEPTLATAIGTVSHYAFEHAFALPDGQRTVPGVQSLVSAGWAALTLPADLPAQPGPTATPPALTGATASRQASDNTSVRAASYPLQNALEYRALAPVGSVNEQRILADSREMVASWFRTENVSRIAPAATEQHLHLTLDETHFHAKVHGIIDRVDELVVAGQRRLYISDYKTGKVPDDRWMRKNFSAMRLYAALAQESYGVQPHALRLVYVRAGAGTGVKVELVTPDTLQEGRTYMSTVWDGMRRAAETGVWEAKVSKLCDWCPFQAACPAQGPELAAKATVMRAERERAAQVVPVT